MIRNIKIYLIKIIIILFVGKDKNIVVFKIKMMFNNLSFIKYDFITYFSNLLKPKNK